jgi:hypothetical protein
MKRNTLPIVGILVIVTLFTTYYYINDVLAVCHQTCYSWHIKTVTQTFTSPFQYRILVPYAVESLTPLHTLVSYLQAYTVAHLVVFGVMYGMLFNWLQAVHDTSRALLGVAIMAVTMSLIFRHSYNGAIYTPVEVCFMAWGLWTLWRLPSRPKSMAWLFGLLVLAASLNRATGLLLPVAYVAMYGINRRNWKTVVCYLALSLAVYFGLRWIIGPARMATPPERALSRSLTVFLDDALINNAMLLPLWLLMIVGAVHRNIPRRIKRLIWLVPAYGMVAFYFGQWNEIRLWLTVFPIAIPLLLTGLPDTMITSQRAATD